MYELPHTASFSLRHPSCSLHYKQENRRGELLSCAEVSASISSSLAGASSSDIQDTIHPTNPSGRHRSNSVFQFRTQTWPSSLVRTQRCDSHSFFLCNKWCLSLLGVFVKSRKAPKSSVMWPTFVRMSTGIDSAPTRCIFVKFYMGKFY